MALIYNTFIFNRQLGLYSLLVVA